MWEDLKDTISKDYSYFIKSEGYGDKESVYYCSALSAILEIIDVMENDKKYEEI